MIVFYAECLVTLTYVYGFDLSRSELPSQVADGYNLNDIGLVKYRYPVGPLAAQVMVVLCYCRFCCLVLLV